MAFVVLDRFSPVVVARRVGTLDADGMARMLDELSRRLRAAGEQLALVYDADVSTAGRPDAASRQVAGEWLRREEALLARSCAGIDFSFASPLSRGVLTAVFWIARPPVPVQVHDNLHAAITSAIARVDRQSTLHADEILRALSAPTG